MMWRLALGMWLISASSFAFAYPTIYCGLMPFPSNTNLQYIVYNGTQDATVNEQVRMAYETLRENQSEFFATYRPQISFATGPEGLPPYGSMSAPGQLRTVIVILGEFERSITSSLRMRMFR